jgi:hypothetical protein
MQSAAAGALEDHGSLVLGDSTLDLQQELIVRRVADRSLAELDVDAGTRELLQQQHLVGILSGQSVGAQHHQHFESSEPVNPGETGRRANY